MSAGLGGLFFSDIPALNLGVFGYLQDEKRSGAEKVLSFKRVIYRCVMDCCNSVQLGRSSSTCFNSRGEQNDARFNPENKEDTDFADTLFPQSSAVSISLSD